MGGLYHNRQAASLFRARVGSTVKARACPDLGSADLTSVARGLVTRGRPFFDLAGEAAASQAEALICDTCEKVQNRERRFLQHAATCA